MVSNRPSSRSVVQAAKSLGEHVSTQRRLLNLTAQQVAERARVSRDTVSRFERGDLGVTMASGLAVLSALGTLDRMVDALNPHDTDLGRARAAQTLPKRVRH